MPKLLDRVKSLLGISAFDPMGRGFEGYGPKATDPAIEYARKAMGGMIQPIPSTQLRWYLTDLELAQAEADSGNLTRACQLYRAMRRDGMLMGLLATRTSGLVRLPRRMYGPEEIVSELRKEVFQTGTKDGSRSVFDEMCPPSELAALVADGDVIGVGVGELVPVAGRDYPVLIRLDPEWLQYVWAESRWYYLSRAGRIPINPGDGRWVLHVPGGRIAPWQWGLWPSLGRAFIMKEHAMSLRGSYIAGVANPAKILQAPNGATEQQRRAMFQHLIQWGPNMAVELPVGWELKLLEVQGAGWKVFQEEIDTCDNQYMVALAGQVVTTTGGAGFSNADIHRMVRSDLIKASAEALSYTLNTQVIPPFVYNKYGPEAIDYGTAVEWDVNTPKDLEENAKTLETLSKAVGALATQYRELNLEELATRYGIPLGGTIKPTPMLPSAQQTLENADAETEAVVNPPEAPEDDSIDVDVGAAE